MLAVRHIFIGNVTNTTYVKLAVGLGFTVFKLPAFFYAFPSVRWAAFVTGENLFIPGQFLGLPSLPKIWQENVTPGMAIRVIWGCWEFKSRQGDNPQESFLNTQCIHIIYAQFTLNHRFRIFLWHSQLQCLICFASVCYTNVTGTHSH